MVDKIEMSLDDIIKTNKGLNRRRRGGKVATSRRGGRSVGVRGGKRVQGNGAVFKSSRGGIKRTTARQMRGDVNSAWKHDLYDGPKRSITGARRTAGGSNVNTGFSKLLVGNLDYGVSESDIRELFAEFGQLKSASVHYDRSGRSLGEADVIFERRTDAIRAMNQYNGVPLDGRPMNIQFVASEIPSKKYGSTTKPAGVSRAIGRGAKRGSRNSGVGRTPKTAPTAEELDAELDAYVNDMKI